MYSLNSSFIHNVILASRFKRIWQRSFSLEYLDVTYACGEVNDYLERFEIWCITDENAKETKQTAYSLSSVGKFYVSIKNRACPKTLISL